MTTLDLRTPVVPSERWHPNFKRIHDLGFPEEWAVLHAWAKGFVDRDGKFVREFQTTFNSSFWELYLHALLRDSGSTIDFSVNRPDFVVTAGPFGRLLAEAVIASNPNDDHAPEWVGGAVEAPTPRPELLDLACLRLAQAIHEKAAKWTSGYASLPHCSTGPYVVCVAPFEQPGGHLQGTEAIDRVLFGGERPVIRADDDGVLRVVGETKFPAVFKAKTGAQVKMGMFTTPAYSQVSAVLFSSLATWSKVRAMSGAAADSLKFVVVRWDGTLVPDCQTVSGPDYSEDLVAGANLFLNPHAARPLDPTPWRDIGVAIHRYNPGGTLTELQRGFLVMRRAFQIGNARSGPVLPHQPPSGTVPHTRARPNDGEFYAGPSQVGFSDCVELTLYKGHTIYIGRDMMDHDWCTMAKPGIHLSLEEFMDAGEPWMGTFLDTRDAALDQARASVDGLPVGP